MARMRLQTEPTAATINKSRTVGGGEGEGLKVGAEGNENRGWPKGGVWANKLTGLDAPRCPPDELVGCAVSTAHWAS